MIFCRHFRAFGDTQHLVREQGVQIDLLALPRGKCAWHTHCLGRVHVLLNEDLRLDVRRGYLEVALEFYGADWMIVVVLVKQRECRPQIQCRHLDAASEVAEGDVHSRPCAHPLVQPEVVRVLRTHFKPKARVQRESDP